MDGLVLSFVSSMLLLLVYITFNWIMSENKMASTFQTDEVTDMNIQFIHDVNRRDVLIRSDQLFIASMLRTKIVC